MFVWCEHPCRKRSSHEGMKAIERGKNVADETAEKFISSLEIVVWCECICRNSISHEGVLGNGCFFDKRFSVNFGSF